MNSRPNMVVTAQSRNYQAHPCQVVGGIGTVWGTLTNLENRNRSLINRHWGAVKTGRQEDLGQNIENDRVSIRK